MPSDPSTKDLIAAARKRPRCTLENGLADLQTCNACLFHALADRLEEVEEERDALAQLVDGWLDEVPEDSPEPDRWEPFPNDEDLAAIIGEDPEPEETDTEYQPTPWEDSDGHDLANHIGALAVLARGDSKGAASDIRDRALALYARIRRTVDADTNDVPERAESVDREPGDDPWAYVERYAATALRTPLRTPFIDALLDLRRRVGDLTQIARDTHTRLNALEGHADRGSEAERELRGRVGRLEDKARHSLRARTTLRDDLEKIDDFTEALAERVERLEALDRATTTVHDNLLEELLGRVETLEADAKVAREMRLRMLGKLSELAKCSTCDGTGRVNGVECICGGHGSRDAEVDGFATALHEAESELADGEGER